MAEELKDIRTNDIWFDDSFNSRGHVTPASVAELADDIIVRGVMQPIKIMPHENAALGTHFKCIMGHRRGAAVKLCARRNPGEARWETIPSLVLDHEIPESEALLMNLQENLVRKDLDMLQEAKAIRRFKEWDWDAGRVAKELGRPRRWVEVRYSLLSMPPEIQDRAAQKYLNQHQVELIALLPTLEEQFAFVRDIVDHKMKGIKMEKDVEEGKKKRAEIKGKRKTSIAIFADGNQRTPADMYIMQDAIQKAWKDNRHPAASALAWAAGVISYDDFVERINQWADVDGVKFEEPEEVVKAS